MPDLKELLGEELYNQVNTKLGDNKIAIVSDGNWIPKDKFDGVNNQLKDYKTQIADRDKQLKELGEKAKGNEELTKQITDLQATNKKTKDDYEAKIQQMSFDSALDKALGAAQAKNPKAVRALLNLEGIKLDGDKILGLDEQLTALKTSDAYLFGENAPQNTPGANPPGGGNPPKVDFRTASKDDYQKEIAKYGIRPMY